MDGYYTEWALYEDGTIEAGYAALAEELFIEDFIARETMKQNAVFF